MNYLSGLTRPINLAHPLFAVRSSRILLVLEAGGGPKAAWAWDNASLHLEIYVWPRWRRRLAPSLGQNENGLSCFPSTERLRAAGPRSRRQTRTRTRASTRARRGEARAFRRSESGSHFFSFHFFGEWEAPQGNTEGQLLGHKETITWKVLFLCWFKVLR